MSNLSNNSVETVNAAANAIVTAERRVQPTSVEKRRWGSCWSLYWCFGSSKYSKRIGHSTHVPETTVPGAAAPAAESLTSSSAIVFPFIAPPSSPASFLQSDFPSRTHSPPGPLSLASLSVNSYSQGGTASLFTIGPYAYETQLVSPPVLSTFTTEPSTASFTPPPEPVQMTTPSSPEVPFAQLLASSLARTPRNSGTNPKFPLSQCDYQPYQLYTGSPRGYLVSPGSTIPNSGTSSPFPDKQQIIEFRVGETIKFLGYEYFSTQKWGSRLGSGSLTPNGGRSRLGSGSVTPNNQDSRLGSGSVTPTGGEARENVFNEIQISEVASLANSDNGSEDEQVVVGHRVSFELPNVLACVKKDLNSSLETVSEFRQNSTAEGATSQKEISVKADNSCGCGRATGHDMSEKAIGDDQEEQCQCKHLGAFGSVKEFNFSNTNGDVSEKPSIGCEWWTSKKVVGKDLAPKNNWTFFPMLQPEVS